MKWIPGSHLVIQTGEDKEVRYVSVLMQVPVGVCSKVNG